MLKKLCIFKFKKLHFVMLHIAAVILFHGVALACNSTDYNYQLFFQTEKIDCDGSNYNPISNCVGNFCNISYGVINSEKIAANDSREVKLLLNSPVFFEPGLKFSDEMKSKLSGSIEAEIAGAYKISNIHVCDSLEVAQMYKKTGLAGGSVENVILTPGLMKKIYSECGIYAVVDISFYSMTSSKNYQFNVKTPAADRRDLARSDKYEVRIRYKITKCENADILWIDEVTGLSEDSSYYSLFEKGLMYNLKQVCINESAL